MSDPWCRQWPVVLEGLRRGETVQVRPPGRSMEPAIVNRALVTIEPLDEETMPEKGEIVFCRVGDRWYVHYVKDVDARRGFLIGNNKGGVNGWVPRAHIYGVVTEVENG